jgi:hypothetical protein
MDFGFLSRHLEVSDSQFSIKGIADWQAIRTKFESQGLISNGIFYMPLKHRGPEPVGRYELPVTHSIESHAFHDEERLRFVIIVLGFLLGLRLLPAGWGHLHGTAIEPGKCNSFTPANSEILPCLELASVYYDRQHPSRNVKRLQSAITLIHWSQIQEHYFDTFNYLYMAIDACWAVCEDLHARALDAHRSRGSGRISHKHRPQVMQVVLGLALPDIFNPASPVTAASIRNDLLHEGLVGDLPVGQTVIQPHCTYEMREFAEKIILTLLGVKAGYVTTPGGDRQRHFLHLQRDQRSGV